MAAIKFEFVATGQDQVLGLYKSVSKAANETATRVSKAANAQASAQEKAAHRAQQAASKAEEKRWREVEKYGAKIQREFEKEADARVRAEEKANRRIAAERQKALGRVAGTGAKVLTGAALTGAGLATGLVGAATRESFQLSRIANRFSINARLAGETIDAGAAKRSFESVALGNAGIKATDVGEAALAFQSKTGKALSKEQLDVMATASSGFGADIQDIGAAMASLHEKFDIHSIEEFKQALATLGVQGAKGSFELKDAATQFEKLSAAAQRFGLDKGVRGVAVLGGFTQIARGSTGSAEQATTAVEATMRQLIKKAPKLAAMGVNVFDKKGQARDFPTVLAETVAKVGGKNIAQKKIGLQNILEEEGIRAVSPLITAFADATLQGKDGMEAVTKVLSDAIDVGGQWNQVQDAASQAQQDGSAQMTLAWQKLVVASGEQLAPKLLQLADHVPELVAALDPAIAALGLFADGMTGVAELMKQWGFLKENTGGRQQQIQRNIDELDKTMAKSGGGTQRQKDLRERWTTELARLQMGGADVETGTTFEGITTQFGREAQKQKAAADYKGLIYGPENPATMIYGPENPNAPGQDASATIAQSKALEAASKAETKAKEGAARAANELATSLRTLRDESARSLPLNQR